MKTTRTHDEDEIDEIAEGLAEDIFDQADDDEEYTREESAELYESVARLCDHRARAIRADIERLASG